MKSTLEAVVDDAFGIVKLAVHEGPIPGAVVGAINVHGDQSLRCCGYAALFPKKRVMQNDTWFDLASLSKVIFTTPHILALAEAGVIDLDAPLTSVLPDFRQYDSRCWERQITFRQCLGHLTSLPAVEPLYTYGQDAELLRAFVLQRAWREGPCVYSDINFILLGLAIERIKKCRLRDLNPGEGFAFSANPLACAATEDCTWRGQIMCGDVHDDNCYALEGAGHAGLFGTAASVLAYAKDLLTGSVSKYSVDLMRSALSDTRTHGWEKKHVNWSGGSLCSNSTIGHTGFTGTGLWIDFERGIAWTLLTNRIHPSRHIDSGINVLRQQTGNTICAL